MSSEFFKEVREALKEVKEIRSGKAKPAEVVEIPTSLRKRTPRMRKKRLEKILQD